MTNTRTTKTGATEAASRYQQLRSHLSALKLHAAAEALPTVLDEAAAQQLSLTAALERLLAIEDDDTEAHRLRFHRRPVSINSTPGSACGRHGLRFTARKSPAEARTVAGFESHLQAVPRR
jgi:hypothetical protein